MITMDFNKKPIPKHPTMNTKKKATNAEAETATPKHWNDVFFTSDERLAGHIDELERLIGRVPLLKLVEYMVGEANEGVLGDRWKNRLAYALAFIMFAKRAQIKGYKADALENLKDAIWSLDLASDFWSAVAIAEFTTRALEMISLNWKDLK
jgi:hypothetical protein